MFACNAILSGGGWGAIVRTGGALSAAASVLVATQPDFNLLQFGLHRGK